MSSSLVSRLLLSVLGGVLVGVVVTCALVVTRTSTTEVVRPPASPGRPATAPADPAGTAGPDRTSAAREVLRSWDAARARAWITGDVDALARLYTPASVAGRRDVAMLAAWNDRGARLRSLQTQVLGLRVLGRRADRLDLVVTDRVARAETVEKALPDDRASTRRLVLVRRDGGWLVASVSLSAPS